MDISTALGYAVTIIYGSEGFATAAYLDRLAKPPIWTIGRGTTRVGGKPVTQGMTCTVTQADAWAAEDMRAAANFVLHVIKVPLNDRQLGALTSLCYNIGDGNFARSTVLAALNLGQYDVAADRLLDYDEAGGKVLSGLETRRRRERAMFLAGQPSAPVTLAGN